MSAQRRYSLCLSLFVAVALSFLMSSVFEAWLPGFRTQALALSLLALAAFALFCRHDDERERHSGFWSLILLAGLLAGLVLRVLSAATATGLVGAGRLSESLMLDLYAGKALLQGLNPYAYSVQELTGEGMRVAHDTLTRARALVATSDMLSVTIAEMAAAEQRAGLPVSASLHVQTPLLALPFLAASQILTPASSLGWYALLLGSDGLCLVLLVMLMLRLRQRLHWVLLFWCNPLWLGGGFDAGSASILIGPLMLLLLWASVSERAALTGFLLALAAGFSLWLSALLPLLLRSAGRRPEAWRRAAYGLVGFTLFMLAFGVLLRLFGGAWPGFAAPPLTVGKEPPGLALFALADGGLLGGATRWAAVAWGVLVLGAGALLALPPLTNQAQRCLRIGALGGFALFLVAQSHPGALLPVIVLLPFTRSALLVAVAGLGVFVGVLTPILSVMVTPGSGLAAETLSRLLIGLVMGGMFVAAWLASLRRNQALE